jgi:hypothetical protein
MQVYLYFNTHALLIQTQMSGICLEYPWQWIDHLIGVYINLNTMLYFTSVHSEHYIFLPLLIWQYLHWRTLTAFIFYPFLISFTL